MTTAIKGLKQFEKQKIQVTGCLGESGDITLQGCRRILSLKQNKNEAINQKQEQENYPHINISDKTRCD